MSQRDPKPKAENNLKQSSSRYLQLHANQSIHWQAWGQDALAKAKRENKLVFISSGYLACHWCHVMAEETFSDEEIASRLNKNFISIKIDREQNPDLDSALMAYVQAASGNAGWPLNVILTPDMEPVAGATYLPPRDLGRRRGFLSLLDVVERLWREQAQELKKTGNLARLELQKFFEAPVERALPSRNSLAEATYFFANEYDKKNGGFGRQAKFPMPQVLRMLAYTARAWPASAEGENEQRNALANSAKEMLLGSIRGMISGAIYDRVGGGFHRYCQDAEWRVPHFEKMLYDQAQLIDVLLDACLVSGKKDSDFLEAIERTISFLENEMRIEQSGFAAAISADGVVGGKRLEGGNFTWSVADWERILGDLAPLMSVAYGIEAQGNIPEEWDPSSELKGRNVLVQEFSEKELAQRFHLSEQEVQKSLNQGLNLLRNARGKNPRDEKILTEWNAYAIAAIARAGKLLERQDWLDLAFRVAFVFKKNYDDLGDLRHELNGNFLALAADYAAMIYAAIELHASDTEGPWIGWANDLQEKLDENWWSEDYGAYLTSRADMTALLTAADLSDIVTPSPTSLSAINLPKLELLTGKKAHGQRQIRLMQALGGRMKENQGWGNSPLATVGVYVWYEGASTLTWTGRPEGKLWQKALQHDRLDLAMRRGKIEAEASGVICNKYGCVILE